LVHRQKNHASDIKSQASLAPGGSTEEDKRATKMDKILIIVCAVVGSLGVLSAIFGFSAEGTKLTVSTTDLLPIRFFAKMRMTFGPV
jgi:hypothetical protein